MCNKRFGMTFETTKDSYYYFDAGTGKVISCSNEEKEFIDSILNNEMTIEKASELDKEFGEFVKKEKLFSKDKWSFIIPTEEEFIHSIKGQCEQIVLELTESCNLRCGYCIYNEHHPNHREFSNKNMSFEVAKKSIDWILSDYRREKFALTFYGGEPLVNFNLMKQCIDYAKKYYGHIKMSYGFTTNLTLLNDEIVDYLCSVEDIDIVCSIDGPKDFHDKFRKDINGKGSFERAMRGFLKLLEKFYNPEKRRGLSINCVLTPPYRKEKLDQISNYFYNVLGIPPAIRCNYSYVDRGDMNFEFEDIESQEASPLENWATDDFLSKQAESKYFDIISVELARVANRFISEKGFITHSYIHGNCVPGQRRIYVTVDGDFKPCEKVGRAPALGNYLTGYNFEESYRKYIKKYTDFFEPLCNNCWARTMCGVCYESSMDGVENSPYIAGSLCDTSREIVKDMFTNYYRIFEKDKEGLAKALSDIDFR